MDIFSDEDFRFERIWRADNSGTVLQVQHVPSGESEERFIGLDDEIAHRRKLQNRLLNRLTTQFSLDDFRIDYMCCGPGQGAALRICHLPSGIAVDRTLGFDPVSLHRPEMIAELFRRLRERKEG